MLLIFGSGGIARAVRRAWGDRVYVDLPHEECDVKDLRRVEDAMAEFRPSHVLCTAGVSYIGADPTLAAHEVMVNLVGSMNVALSADPDVPVVLMGSVAGLYGKPGHVGYSASKAGVISVVQSLALEGKQIWCVSPGRVDTPMRERDYPGDTPGSRLDASEVADLIVALLLTGKTKMGTVVEPGGNVIIRKVGLETVKYQVHEGDGWRERLRVGLPVTI